MPGFPLSRLSRLRPPGGSPSLLRMGTLVLFLLVPLDLPTAAQDRFLPVFHFREVKGRPSAVVWSNVARDSFGFVWIGTVNGLERYDGYGVAQYRHAEHDSFSISSNIVRSLFCDSKNRLWIATEYTGLSLYDPFRDRFLSVPLPPAGDGNGDIRFPGRFLEDRSGGIWFPATGGVVRIEPPAGSGDLDSLARHLRFTTIPTGTPHAEAYDLCVRRDGQLIVGTDSGLLVLHPGTLTLTRPRFTDTLARRLDSLVITCLVQAPDGAFWVGTETEGLFRIDWDRGTATNFRHREGDIRSITHDDILSLALDPRGGLWVGTIKGFDLFSPAEGHRTPYVAYGSGPGGGIRQKLSVDDTGTLWFVASNGVFWLSPRSLLLPHFAPTKADGQLRSIEAVERERDGTIWFLSEGELIETEIAALEITDTIDVFHGRRPDYSEPEPTSSLIDRQGHFWYAGWDLGLFRVDLTTKRIDSYGSPRVRGIPSSIWSIAQGSGDSLWIGTYRHGVWTFDPARNEFFFPRVDSIQSAVARISDGTLWISTVGEGLIVHNPATGTTSRILHDPSDPHSLSDNLARAVYEDPAGHVWVGAGGGLNLWDPATLSFLFYPNPAFEKAIFVVPLGSDRGGRLWTRHVPAGLSSLDPATRSYTNFDVACGLCGSPTDLKVLDDGRILLTGTDGLNVFHPDSLRNARRAPPLLVTQLVVNDSLVIPMPHAGASGTLRFTHRQNMLELAFAAIDIDAPYLVQYQYRLEGLEADWVKAKDRRFVRYAGLPPGEYTFRLKARSVRGEWQEQETTLAFTVAPPWWQTAWAYGGYLLLGTGLLVLFYRLRLRQMRLTQQSEIEHFRAEHLAEVDRLKSRFFYNVSHEFRTPLSLILGPADQALEATEEPSTRQRLHLIRANAEKLLRLVNQLLDFSRLESGMMRLQVANTDIVPFLRRVVMAFESWAERKHITLEFRPESGSIPGYVDADKLEKTVNNLLSNALKFTPEGGSVKVAVGVAALPHLPPFGGAGRPSHGDEKKRGGEGVVITVSDTGRGIPAEQLPRVFDRFYRADETHTTEGTGIGLALTKELVELHHGTIAARSTAGEGSVFTVTLPIGESAYRREEIIKSPLPDGRTELAPISASSGEAGNPPPSPPCEDRPVVLVVEDNADLRAYVSEYLRAEYAVLEAGDGREGCVRAMDAVPDIVICDVMMPGMDGLELCRTLKRDVRTSHVPVILLTARAGTESKIEGLETGADDYVTKPFDAKELLARVRNLIEQRRRLRARFSAGGVLQPGEVAVSSLDDALLQRVMETIEQRMGNESLGAEEVAREVALSRRHLDRKLMGLAGLSAAELIRSLRLQRARQLLERNAATVAEIAFQVGFGSPSHFSACFRERFGCLPSEVRRQPT